MALIDDVKKTLRISLTAHDTEITDLIAAAKADLGICGLLTITETDPLIKRAIITYCKANFGWDNPESEKLQMSYESIRNHLSLSQDYAYFAVTFVVKNAAVVAIREAKIIFNDEEKLTNTLGTVIFYVRAGSNFEYAISHEDYIDYVDSNGDNYKVDISASITINITMVV